MGGVTRKRPIISEGQAFGHATVILPHRKPICLSHSIITFRIAHFVICVAQRIDQPIPQIITE